MSFFDIIRYKRSCFAEKNFAPAMGQHTHEYILYSVGDNHYTLHSARRVLGPLGIFCRITSLWRLLKIFSESEHFAGSEGRRRCLGSGKGENHLVPWRKGVRKWNRAPATMTRGDALMISVRRSCETRPGAICGAFAASGSMSFRFMLFRGRKWTGSAP